MESRSIAVLKSQLVYIIDVLHNTYVIVQIEKLSDYEQLFLICFLPTMQANIFSRQMFLFHNMYKWKHNLNFTKGEVTLGKATSFNYKDKGASFLSKLVMFSCLLKICIIMQIMHFAMHAFL